MRGKTKSVTHEQKVCDIEIEIVINRIVLLTSLSVDSGKYRQEAEVLLFDVPSPRFFSKSLGYL